MLSEKGFSELTINTQNGTPTTTSATIKTAIETGETPRGSANANLFTSSPLALEDG